MYALFNTNIMKDLSIMDIYRRQDLAGLNINTVAGYYKTIKSFINQNKLKADIKQQLNSTRIYIDEKDWEKFLTKLYENINNS